MCMGKFIGKNNNVPRLAKSEPPRWSCRAYIELRDKSYQGQYLIWIACDGQHPSDRPSFHQVPCSALSAHSTSCNAFIVAVDYNGRLGFLIADYGYFTHPIRRMQHADHGTFAPHLVLVDQAERPPTAPGQSRGGARSSSRWSHVPRAPSFHCALPFSLLDPVSFPSPSPGSRVCTVNWPKFGGMGVARTETNKCGPNQCKSPSNDCEKREACL